jgi:hypothetical protein
MKPILHTFGTLELQKMLVVDLHKAPLDVEARGLPGAVALSLKKIRLVHLDLFILSVA